MHFPLVTLFNQSSPKSPNALLHKACQWKSVPSTQCSNILFEQYHIDKVLYELKYTHNTHTHTLIDYIYNSRQKKKKGEKVQTLAYLTLSSSAQKACFCRFSSFIVSGVSSPLSLCSIHPTLAINLPHNKNIIQYNVLFLVKDIDFIEIYWLAHRKTTQRKYVVFAHFNPFLAHCGC